MWVPQAQIKACVMVHVSNCHTRGGVAEIGGLGGYWPAALAEMVSFRFSERLPDT